MEGCCLFVTYQWGNPQAPIYRGNAEGFRLVEPPARRGQNAPMDTLLKRPTREPRPPARRELKKSPSSLDQEGLCKGLKRFIPSGTRALYFAAPVFPFHGFINGKQ
ncbi:MAG: hypothetical protein R6T98_12320 [Desulfatiglandales bacterium]